MIIALIEILTLNSMKYIIKISGQIEFLIPLFHQLLKNLENILREGRLRKICGTIDRESRGTRKGTRHRSCTNFCTSSPGATGNAGEGGKRERAREEGHG